VAECLAREDAEREAAERAHAERAQRDLRAGQPRARNNSRAERRAHTDRIAREFEERFAIIKQVAPEIVGEFRAEAALGRNELFALRRCLYEAEQEREAFRQRHKCNGQGESNLRVLFGIGFTFSLVGMTDGVFFTDPYPGNGAEAH
jgi:hypothetical protein